MSERSKKHESVLLNRISGLLLAGTTTKDLITAADEITPYTFPLEPDYVFKGHLGNLRVRILEKKILGEGTLVMAKLHFALADFEPFFIIYAGSGKDSYFDGQSDHLIIAAGNERPSSIQEIHIDLPAKKLAYGVGTPDGLRDQLTFSTQSEIPTLSFNDERTSDRRKLFDMERFCGLDNALPAFGFVLTDQFSRQVLPVFPKQLKIK